MMNARCGLAVFVLVVGCAARAGSAPAAAPAEQPPTTAPAMPPAAPAPSADTCAGFEKLPFATKKASLLGDRLFITPLEGLENHARPHDIMSAAAPEEHETRLLLQQGELKLVVWSEELFARSTPNLLKDVQRTTGPLRQVPGEERKLDSGLRAVLFVEPKLEAPNEAVPVAHVVTVLPDDTLQITHVFVTPSVVSAGSAGCRALALKLLGSIEPGPRRLDLAGGRRELEDGYSVQVPPSYSLTAQRGPDFTVFQLMPLLPLGEPAGRLGMYFGRHPDFEPNPAAQKLNATILGKPATWHRSNEDGEIGQEALLEPGRGLAIHLFLAAPNVAAADELARLAASLKRGK